MESKPETTVSIAEGTRNPAAGLTYQQIGRQGWGFQKSQNGGAILPPPALVSVNYHRYGSRVPASGKERTFYDGIDISLNGIASLDPKPPDFLTKGLAELSALVDAANQQYRIDNPGDLVPGFAAGLKEVRSLRRQVESSSIAEPGRSNVAFELTRKEEQFQEALSWHLGLTFNVNVAPEKPPTGPFARFAGVQAYTHERGAPGSPSLCKRTC